ncbi:NuoI/complex I 23 kDa subunit family protein [Sulfurospirillum oryzae]|uniref:NuoI/complex I 23 kDa subunit family protein n=1 Tax=Sulfurospirillum oryzae TaxID=2976535 RepID=UPI0021E9672D|nr:NADH-quinone oxidoreductase subunit I [Sulfurospirillum oryzae]
MGIKIVHRHGNTFKEKLYLPAIFGGMKTTLSHFITNLGDKPEIKTINYPEEQPHDISERYRGAHRLTKREDGSVRCVACFMCATACPAECIFIEAKERDDGVDEKMPELFNIDLLECVFCGGCVEACPCDAIRMDSGIFSFIGKKREDFVLTKEQLLANEEKKR